MVIDGIEITYVSVEDGVPIKNKLPVDLKERLKTQNQWMDEGYVVKEGAPGYGMHPSVLSKRVCMYYLDSDVVSIDSSIRCCGTCAIRSGRYCVVAGDYVSLVNGACSEWVSEDEEL